MTNLRIGHGYDVRRLAERRKQVLGGADLHSQKGCLGDSD